MKVGVLNSVIGGRDDLDCFERARSIGCAGVEVMLLREHLRGTEKLETLRAARAATKLEIPSFVLDEHNLGGIASADAGVAAAAAADVRIAIAWAAELGVAVILIPFFVEAEIRHDAAFDRAVDALRELCPLASASGVVLAYEGTLPAARVHALAERIGSAARCSTAASKTAGTRPRAAPCSTHTASGSPHSRATATSSRRRRISRTCGAASSSRLPSAHGWSRPVPAQGAASPTGPTTRTTGARSRGSCSRTPSISSCRRRRRTER